jgi:hypothetical protein
MLALERPSAIKDNTREHQHANVWIAGADLDRSAQPVVLVVWRHLNVDNHHIGVIRADLRDDVSRVASSRDDFEPTTFQHTNETLPERRPDATRESRRTRHPPPRNNCAFQHDRPQPLMLEHATASPTQNPSIASRN